MRATAFGAWRDIASNIQGGRVRLSQALLAKNKRRSERCSRCAARAALDLNTDTPAPPSTYNLKCPTIPFKSVPNCASSTLDLALSCIANAA